MATSSTTVSTLNESARTLAPATRTRNIKRREALLGLLFVAPVMIIVLIFQLFPVAYGFYISLQDQLGVLPDGFVGLANFVRAVGSFAYIIPLIVATILAVYGVGLYQKGIALQTERGISFRPYLIPGFIVGGATIVFTIIAFRYGIEFTIAPAVVLVAGLIGYAVLNGTLAQSTNDPTLNSRYMLWGWGVGLCILSAILLVAFTFSELGGALAPLLEALPLFIGTAAQPAYIFPVAPQFFAFFGVVAGVSAILVINALRERLDPDMAAGRLAALGVLRLVLIALVLVALVYGLAATGAHYQTVNSYRSLPEDSIRTRLAEVRGDLSTEQRLAFSASRVPETSSRLLAWTDVYTMLLGIGFLFFAYYLWDGARKRDSTPGMLGTLFIALCLMIGGYFFIGELPGALAAGDKAYYDSLIRTVTYAIGTVPLQLILGLALAYLLFHEVKRGKGMYRLIFFLPYIAPTVATAAVFAMIFSSSKISPANQIVGGFGLPPQEWLQTTKGIFEIIAERISPGTRLPNFLIGPSLPLLSAILYAIWVFSGYNAVVFMSGLGAVPKEVYEAAQVDGAGRWTTFRRIVFPLISPTTYFLSLLAIIGTFRAFTHIWVLRSDSRGAIDTSMIYIYDIIQSNAGSNPRTYASTLSFLLFGIILILTIIQNRYSRDRVFYG